ncbi:DUF1573 domain-containing protein [Yeosuana marina]|uniref:DUF1573 domain-containing protein n=1 Tax=Yeosuana marina TaxID=1565536 RepID=UPI0030C88D43
MTHPMKQSLSFKSICFLALCLFTFSFGFSQDDAAKKAAGVLSFDTTEIDYGTIQQNDNGERTFKFKNTGDAPIIISQVRTSCGCTVPSYSKNEPVLPGETSEIKVKYATNRLGVFNKTITVMSNASEPSKLLHIKGEVKPKPADK